MNIEIVPRVSILGEDVSFPLTQSALREIDAQIVREPDVIRHQFERARLLTRLGRLQEAKNAYIDILKKDLSQFTSFINLGVVLMGLGHRQAALKVFQEVTQRFPDSPLGPLNVARISFSLGKIKEARGYYESALRTSPNHADTHYGFSDFLMDQGEEEAGIEHRRKGFESQPWTASTYRGENEPVRLLLLGTARGGNAPIQRFLDDRIFLTLATYVDFYSSALPIPSHQVVINLIGDVDRCGCSLDQAEHMLERVTAPVLNPPAKIRTTGRADNARILGAIDGVVTPRIVTLSRSVLVENSSSSLLEQHGFNFPILLRAPGFHGGIHFSKVERPEDLASVVATLPGEELAVIQYLDVRNEDRKTRKYRVMMIDGKLYPLHKAISEQWKVHYFSAQMAEYPEHRDEEAAFLEDMSTVLGQRAMCALKIIQETLALDYAGVDFSLGPGGEVMVFEANATMAAPPPEKESKWDYRRGSVERFHSAVRDMILARVQQPPN